jgi:hypothetical protein
MMTVIASTLATHLMGLLFHGSSLWVSTSPDLGWWARTDPQPSNERRGMYRHLLESTSSYLKQGTLEMKDLDGIKIHYLSFLEVSEMEEASTGMRIMTGAAWARG